MTAVRTRLPATSAIICSRHRPQLLLESVISVLNGEELPSELLIMDQSDRAHPQLATLTHPTCDVRYIQTDVIGECPARNQGIGLAKHDLLVFTDDDVLVQHTWFGALVRSLESHGARTLVTGRVLPSTEHGIDGFAPSTKVDSEPAVYTGRIWQDVVYPMNMATYRQTFHDIGMFDERLGAGGPFPGAEDNDFGFRVLEAGYQIVYDPLPTLYHRAWRRMREYVPLHWKYGYGQGAYYAKHIQFHDRYMFQRLRWSVLKHIRLALRLANQDRREAAAHASYAAGMLYGSMKWMITQRVLASSAGR